MTSTSNSRAVAFPSSHILAAFFALALFTVPQRTLARAPQSADAPPAQQQTPEPAKRDPAPASPVAAAAAKANAPKPHRVFTNEDLSPNSGMPIAPGANRRLKQLNRCNRTCFVEVEKQGLAWGFTPPSRNFTARDLEDRLANDIEELQNDPKWQRLLLEMISAHIDSCLLRQKPRDNLSTDAPTRGELQDEEERMKNYRPPPGSNFNAASSAVLAYRFSSKPDPLRASLMVHQYMDEIHRDCDVVLPTSNSQDDSDDP